MVDKDQDNDGYQFAELDGISNEVVEEPTGDVFSTENPHIASDGHAGLGKNPILRNAVIAIAVIIFLMVLYKFVGSIFSDKKSTDKTALVAPVSSIPAPIEPVMQPMVPVTNSATINEEKDINQKLSALEVGQQSMRSDVTSANNQLSGINSTLSSINGQLAELHGVINNLTAQLADQSQIIAQMNAHRVVKKISHHVKSRVSFPKYFLQAVIPGRAWLIATNGATLTVREGNTIAGYGIVKLIDPSQGRVVTSSGQIIRFSQADS